MVDLATLVEEAKRSDLFTAPRLEADLAAFLQDQSDRVRRLAQRTAKGEFDQVYFVGSGGSWSNMYSGQYLTDRYTSVPAEVLTSYELIWRRPVRLGPRALVFAASYSGSTEDTLAALRHANDAGATTVALTRRHESPMSAEADEVIDYESTALYILPLAAVTLYAFELCRLSGGARRKDADRPSSNCPTCRACWGSLSARRSRQPRASATVSERHGNDGVRERSAPRPRLQVRPDRVHGEHPRRGLIHRIVGVPARTSGSARTLQARCRRAPRH